MNLLMRKYFVRKYEDMRAKCGKMSRDGDKDKQYKTCQEKPNLIDQEYLNNFLNKANSYESIFEELKNTNPGKADQAWND